MKKISIIIISIFPFFCKSQTITLEQAAHCLKNSSCPNFDYEKDINNSLEKYVGIWSGSYNGKIYELKFAKSLYENFVGHKRDRIIGRMRISSDIPNSTTSVLIFDNFNEPNEEKIRFSGLGFQPDLRSYMMSFVGPSVEGCINYGTVYLTIKPNTPNKMKIFYWSDSDIVVGDCPNSFEQTFPEKQSITLTKQ